MKLTFNWLMELVEIPDAAGGASFGPDELAERLTHAGLEVDAVRPLSDDTGAVVVEITGVEPHPNADRLSVCRIEDGGEPLGIVCGAPNVRPGLKTAFLRVGSVLPSGQTIERRPIRGVPSEGHALLREGTGLLRRPPRHHGAARRRSRGRLAQRLPGPRRLDAGGEHHAQPGRLSQRPGPGAGDRRLDRRHPQGAGHPRSSPGTPARDPGLGGDPGPGAVPALLRPADSRTPAGAIAALAPLPPRGLRHPLHQPHRGRHQLRDAGSRPAAPRL